jgi:hypothetical protein
MEERASIQGIPIGGVQTARQSVATDPLTFHVGRNGLATGVALRSTPHTGWGADCSGVAQPELFHEGGAGTSAAS